MSRLASISRLLRQGFTSVLFFALLGLVLGVVITWPLIPKPNIGTISISGIILDQSYADDILKVLRSARDDNRTRAVVLLIDSPGGYASIVEQIYSDMLRLRSRKPVVAVIGAMGASGGYYIAVAANYIYAQPTSMVGSIGAWSGLPEPEEVDEQFITSGLFKATGVSKRKAVAELEMVKQGFVSAVTTQRADRLKLSSEELSLAEIYTGVDSLKSGLIDDIGTSTDAIEKAASLAGLRSYEVLSLYRPAPSFGFFFFSFEKETLRTKAGSMPAYYYLHFESE